MATNSDHKKPFNDINKYMPEVYDSDVNRSVFDMAFNRHLTKDDTARVAGFIGQGNPQAIIDRQIKEVTPHRQAFQLAPTMLTKVGTVETALSFKAFQGQLELMGVDIDRIPKWANTLQFNWAPPVNIDMLVNYQDYFWKPDNAKDPAQYFTVEARCNKVQSKVQAYANTLALRGSSFAIIRVVFATDQFVITGKFDDLFAPGFVFHTDTSTNANIQGKQWTAASAVYNSTTNETTIEVVESIATAGPTPPLAPIPGKWWYDTSVPALKTWSGTTWVLTSQSIVVNIDLTRLLDDFTYEANCVCNEAFGWDVGRWDQADGAQWDASDTCVAQVLNEWSTQNKWIHKSQVQSFSDVKRAQVPIFEYNSTVEQNEWTKVTYAWKYRETVDVPFLASVKPTRFELEPVKEFVATNIAGIWYVYLFGVSQQINRDIDYTTTFIPGYRFRFTDDTLASEVYTVASSQYRQIVATDDISITSVAGINYFCTVVALEEPTFTSQSVGGGLTHVRLEPILTSRGDTWRGYHVHWVLDQTATQSVAASSRSWNHFLISQLQSPPSLVAISALGPHTVGDTLPFVPAATTIVVGTAYQEIVVDIIGATQIDLVDQLRFNTAVPGFYATPNSDDLRVYVNNVRQYANYTELTGVDSPSYTLVGQTAQTSQQIEYVKAIVFNTVLPQFSTVRIEVGPASQEDMGVFAVPVRTVEDEAAFTIATAAGTQPVYVSLSNYRRLEQSKRTANQYPQFNVYDVVTSEVVKASHLFGFRESPTYPINSSVGKRIVASADGREYEFEQFLLDRSDNILYGYRNTFNPPSYWFSPELGSVKYWDGKAWTDKILVTLSSGAVASRSAVISTLPPATHVEKGFWLNPTVPAVLKQYLGAAWVTIPGLVTADTDPTLETIWKSGHTNQQYVPTYVDNARIPTTIGSPAGDWEVVDQWFYNPEHHNAQYVEYSQIITHFRTILQGQLKIPGLIGGGVFTLSQNDVDFGVGGTIKEHNDSFDTLISAVNVTNVTPVGVIDFAEQQYASQLLSIRELFNKSITILLTASTPESLVDFINFASNYVINRYESNDFAGQTFGDSVAFNPVTGTGVRNWIATTPMLGLAPLLRPHLTVDKGVVRLFHHDGHRTQVSYSSAELDKLIRIVCNTADQRSSGSTFGKISSAHPPTAASAVITAFGYLRPSVYWYRISGSIRSFARFSPYSIGGVAPSFFNDIGNEIPDNTMYYNTLALAVYKKVGLTWVAVTAIGAGNISPLWVDMDLPTILGSIQLEVESRLYEVTPELLPVFDYALLTSDTAEQTTFASLHRKRFNAFLIRNNISAPFTNTEYAPSNSYTWNYTGSVPLTPPRSGPIPIAAGSWQEVYTRWYRTPFPHLEPWTLQGFAEKPIWWDTQYLDTTGARRWIYNHATQVGMWENIRTGQVPAGRTYPSGVISTGNSVIDGQSLTLYNYFSVNISNSMIAGGYGPDDLLPPYYDTTSIVGLPTVRSLFTSYSSEINAPDADYVFGDVGPVEWLWSASAQKPYDTPTIAFLMQPARFMHAAFGPRYTIVNGLQVEKTFKQVYSHEDVLFHGDVFNTSDTYLVRGINQWYVNFNRVSGFDTNGQFRQQWAGWNPRLTYQFAGIIDTSTFEIASKYFDIINQDYEVILANNGVIKDAWVDAFEASLLSIPPALVQYNNEAAWKIDIDSLSSTPRDIKHYGVKSYPFVVNSVTDICTAFSYAIVGANSPARRFNVVGDHTAVFISGTTFTVSGAGTNNGTYTVSSSVFETTANSTRINVTTSVSASNSGGTIDLLKSIPWATGAEIVISSSKFLPAPLLPNVPYYIIRLTGKTFKLAETLEDALNLIAIDLTSIGSDGLRVSQVETSFFVFGGAGNTQDLWFHYALDKTDIRSFVPPHTVVGMQRFISLIDGYAAYQADQDILQNIANSNDFDPDTGRLTTWALETERFIDWAYGLRNSRITVADRYPVTTNTTNNTMAFGAAVPMWVSGTAVVVTSSGDLPDPIILGSSYYVINTGTPGIIHLSTSANASDLASIVNLTSVGSGQVLLGAYTQNRSFPRFELNPARNNIWINTPLGVLSNVIAGPYSDIRIQQTIFDQYSRPIGGDQITVYREDKRSHVTIRPSIPNDIDPIYVDDPYNYIHIGGAHLFVEGYEHFLVFKNYTVGNALVYDPFLGLNTTKFNVDYFEKEDYTLRPTLGGYYLLDQQFYRNVEGSASDIQNYYDALELSETSAVARRSRALLGYKGRSQFLDFLNINSKSQFLFYRGMIQTKGSVNSVAAYINSRRFVDAKLDEFWAWKIAEFGDSRVRIYPEIKLFSTDSRLDDVRLEFLAGSELETDQDVIDAVNKGFQLVTFQDEKRWNIFPEQKALIKSPLFLDTDVTSLTLIHASVTPPPPGAEATIAFWFNADTQSLFAYNVSTKRWDVNNSSRILVQSVQTSSGPTDMVYFTLNKPCDDVRVIHRILTSTNYTITASTSGSNGTFTLSGDRTGDITVDVPFAVSGSSMFDGAYYPTSVVFDGVNTVVMVPTVPVGAAPLGFITAQNFGLYTTEVYNQGSGIKEITKVDSEVVRFNIGGFQDIIMLFTLDPAREKMSPAKLIDTKTNTVVQQIPMWDPARGHHSHGAIHNVDLQYNGDPARYEFAVNPVMSSENFWNQQEVGKVMLDTAELGYMPYYDNQVYTDVNERLYNWGKLAPWASVKVYEWVRSTVPPAQWDATVLAQQANSTIAQNNKATGTPRKSVFKRVRELYNVTTINPVTGTLTIPGAGFSSGDQVVFTATTISGRQTIAWTDLFGAAGSGLANDTTVYTATIIVDGTPHAIAVVGSAAQTFAAVVADINSDLAGSATVAIISTKGLQVTSSTTGVTSSVSIIDGTLFAALTNVGAFGKPIIGGVITDLPTGIEPSVKYVVSLTLTPDEYVVYASDTEDSVSIGVSDNVALRAAPTFSALDWNKQGLIRDRTYAPHVAVEAQGLSVPTIASPGTIAWPYLLPLQVAGSTPIVWTPITPSSWILTGVGADTVDVYVNGKSVDTGLSILPHPANTSTSIRFYILMDQPITLNEHDIIDIIRPVRPVSAADIAFNPDIDDDGLQLIQWKDDYEYSSNMFTTGGTNTGITSVTYYYFWVQNSTTRDLSNNTTLSAFEIARQLEAIPTPYFVVQRPKDDPYLTEKYGYGMIEYGSIFSLGILTEADYQIPVLYREAIIRKVASYINDDDRYVVRFTRDWALRDDIQANSRHLNLKEKHQEWYMFRREQTSTLPRDLWDRMIESLVGYKLTDPTIRVPSLERELYDAIHGSDTRFGLGDDQSFVDKALGLSTVLAYLTNPINDFSPTDIDAFFAVNSFDTSPGIIAAMSAIYTTFNATHVNAIWFETLLDAFSTRSKYKELMKTSWVALHGIRVLEVGGLFDD